MILIFPTENVKGHKLFVLCREVVWFANDDLSCVFSHETDRRTEKTVVGC